MAKIGRAESGSTTTRSRSAASRVTTDHEEIRRWAEERGAQPARVRRTGGGEDPGILRLDFPGYSGGESLEHISWEEFLEKFDDNNLALLYQEQTAQGQRSNFNKLIDRGAAQATTVRSRSQRTQARARRAASQARSRRRSTRSRRTRAVASRRSSRRKASSTQRAQRRSSRAVGRKSTRAEKASGRRSQRRAA